MTPSGNLEINSPTGQEYQGQIDLNRIFPQHVLQLSRDQIISHLSILCRNTIYEQDLYVIAPEGPGPRMATPDYYKIHPPCLNRLIHWLNRELGSIWRDNEAHVNTVLKFITSLLMKYNIESQEFRIQIQPYLGSYTHHFIHELYSFATSVYDMECYDELANYVLAPHSTDGAEHSSPGNDSNAIFTGENSFLSEQNQESERILKYRTIKDLIMILKKKGNSNSWQPNIYLSSSSSDPEPSTSGVGNNFPMMDGNVPTSTPSAVEQNIPTSTPISAVEQNIPTSTPISAVEQTQDDDDDDILVLDVVKPPTPIIVDLSSDEEDL